MSSWMVPAPLSRVGLMDGGMLPGLLGMLAEDGNGGLPPAMLLMLLVLAVCTEFEEAA